MHEIAYGSVNYNSDNGTHDPFSRHGIDQKHETGILKKIENRIAPFASLFFLLSIV